TVLLATAPAAGRTAQLALKEYRLPASTLTKLRADFLNQLASRYPQHSWAPLRFSLTNRDLKLMGLPSKRWLIRHRQTFGSTAAHCGKPGDTATAIGLVGNNTPVLLNFGSFAVSHSAGLGSDWALISILPQYQNLVTPTMAFWGGPIGMYTAQGQVVPVNLS